MKAFTIGRGTKNNFILNNTTVSTAHAKIDISPDFKTFVLIDLDSTNGTKVNGQTILTKKIDDNAKIELGTFVINTKDLIKEIKKFVHKNRIDFSVEFGHLKTVEINYKKKKNNINKFFKLKSAAVRIFFTIVAMIALSLSKSPIIVEYRRVLLISVGTVGALFSTLSVSQNKLSHKLDDLYVDFTTKFKCPKCFYELTNKSWKYWSTKDKCPKCKCIWIKK